MKGGAQPDDVRRALRAHGLDSCRAGDRVVVGSVEGSAARIDRLAAVGILPGVELSVQQTRPVVVVESGETVLALEREIAAGVQVVLAPAGLEKAAE
jgi:Fe2+ transport system protein FeoA